MDELPFVFFDHTIDREPAKRPNLPLKVLDARCTLRLLLCIYAERAIDEPIESPAVGTPISPDLTL